MIAKDMILTRLGSLAATAKDTEYGFNEKFLYALTGMQGWRICE